MRCLTSRGTGASRMSGSVPGERFSTWAIAGAGSRRGYTKVAGCVAGIDRDSRFGYRCGASGGGVSRKTSISLHDRAPLSCLLIWSYRFWEPTALVDHTQGGNDAPSHPFRLRHCTAARRHSWFHPAVLAAIALLQALGGATCLAIRLAQAEAGMLLAPAGIVFIASAHCAIANHAASA